MKNKDRSLSVLQLAFAKFRRNRIAMIAAGVIVFLYACAIGADFLAPYTYKFEDRKYSYCPPTKIHFVRDGRLSLPYVSGIKLTFDDLRRRVYVPDHAQRYPLKLFVKGESYKFMGLIPTDRHLIGVEEPGRFYLLGADARGRDILSRLFHGARISLSIGLIGVAISFTIGLLVGGIAGFYGGGTDNILMRVCEMFMMVPSFYLLLALRAAVPDTFNSVQIYFAIIIILSFLGWASLARIIRGMCLSLRERDYVTAARAMGLSDLQIIVRHILPHTVSFSIFAVMLSIPGYILSESALSLLGLGIQDPYASWGNMLTDAMSILRIKFAPWILWPAFFIFLTVMAFNIVGEALRDALDPKLKG